MGEQLPFDVASLRTIQVDHRDMESVENCKSELKTHIHALEANASVADNPISLAIDLEAYSQSGNPVEETNAVIIDFLARIYAQVRAVF